MKGVWSRSSWLMAFPIFSLLSLSTTLFSWVSSILISSHRATIIRFIPVGPESMSRILWVWFLCYLKSVHREVAPERPLLAAPQGYLRCSRARARLVGEDPYH